MNKFVAFLSDESGAAAAEYVLILAIIGSAIAVSAIGFGNSIGTALDNAGTAISGMVFPDPTP
jgi:pilus assembly protein Flp/PilA